MILPLMNKKSRNKHYDIGLAEVHYLWHIVKAKYDFLQLLDIWLNQVHDQDLLVLIKMYGLVSFANTSKPKDGSANSPYTRGCQRGAVRGRSPAPVGPPNLPER